MAKYVFGVDVGGTTVKMGLFDKDGNVLEKWEIPTRTENRGEKILPDIAASIQEKMAQKSIAREDVEGVGIGVPGPVEKNGIVHKAVNLGWEEMNMKEELTALLDGMRVEGGNDANVAALGEMWKGGGRGYDSIVMVTLGTGVGGGIIHKGKILTGSKGAGGEIGHTKVEINETEVCGCGNKGCLEQYASATGIVRLAKKYMKADSCLAGRDKISAKMIFDEAKAGDAYCQETVERFGRYLGIALSNVAHVVDPEAFVIGGGVSRAGEIILNVVEKYYNENAMFALKDKEFRLAELGNDAGIYGAVRMVLLG